jgi:hypothetical protein
LNLFNLCAKQVEFIQLVLKTSWIYSTCLKQVEFIQLVWIYSCAQLRAVRIEMENYSTHTDHGLSMDRTSIGTGRINTRVDSIESAKYG